MTDGKVLLIGKIHGLAGETAANRTIPRCDVQNSSQML